MAVVWTGLKVMPFSSTITFPAFSVPEWTRVKSDLNLSTASALRRPGCWSTPADLMPWSIIACATPSAERFNPRLDAARVRVDTAMMPFSSSGPVRMCKQFRAGRCVWSSDPAA